jgi:hypothetical protein
MRRQLLPKISQRFQSSAGIAIGPILFVIALLAILAAAISVGGDSFSTAGVADRVGADVQAQANLIRSKIMECNLLYGTINNLNGYPSSDTSVGSLVSTLNCSGDPAGAQSLWSGSRVTMLPPPTSGFDNWHYINPDTSTTRPVGGICIWTSPTVANAASNAGIVEGLSKAARKFSNSASFDVSSEVTYDPANSSQKFTLWIVMPTGTPNANCLP